MRDRDAGVTLLEVLVALVVLAFITLALAQGTRFGLMAWDRQGRLIDQRAQLDAVDRVLRGLIGQMARGADTDPPGIIGDAARLAFTSELPLAASGLATREADLLLTTDGRHRLLIRWTPHLHARRLGPAPVVTETVLLDGVDRLELAYWPPDASGWKAAWKDRVPPMLVRIRVLFMRGDGRHWPDIVARPLLGAS